MLIPKDIADVLELEISSKTEEAEGIGGIIKTARTTVNLSITDGKETIYLPSIPVEVLLEGELKEILIGRIPFFSEFDITFKENSKRIEMFRTKRC